MSTITVPRGLLERALDALEIGYESASVEAAQYHAAMAGYRQERHAAMDADVQKIAAAITALRAALEQREQDVPETDCGNMEPSVEQLNAILDGLSGAYVRESAREFLRVWIRDWTMHKLDASPRD